jgi:hypothetical protein
MSWKKPEEARRHFIGGSDARIIMGSDEKALLRLWREKRGEIEPEDLSSNLVSPRTSIAVDTRLATWLRYFRFQHRTNWSLKVRRRSARGSQMLMSSTGSSSPISQA